MSSSVNGSWRTLEDPVPVPFGVGDGSNDEPRYPSPASGLANPRASAPFAVGALRPAQDEAASAIMAAAERSREARIILPNFGRPPFALEDRGYTHAVFARYRRTR